MRNEILPEKNASHMLDSNLNPDDIQKFEVHFAEIEYLKNQFKSRYNQRAEDFKLPEPQLLLGPL